MNTPDDKIAIYLNSLPSDIEVINLIRKGLTKLPDLSRFTNLKKFYCGRNRITSLPELPSTLTCVQLDSNRLTSLPKLPDSLQILFCDHNYLKRLPKLPVNLYELDCDYNCLKKMPTLPKNLKHLFCANNNLSGLPKLPTKLERLHCSYNYLTSLPNIPNNVVVIDCQDNDLTRLPKLPTNLEELNIEYNHLTTLPTLPLNMNCLDIRNTRIWEFITTEEMEDSEYIDAGEINCRVETLNRFRYSYFLLKLKPRFRKWLWERVREPKIQAQYHPRYLMEKLQDDDADLDEVLREW